MLLGHERGASKLSRPPKTTPSLPRSRDGVLFCFTLGAAAVAAIGIPAISACASSSATATRTPFGVPMVRDAGTKPSPKFTFKTIDDPADPTTEVLGIDNSGNLCGFHDHPSLGFTVRPSYNAKKFSDELYPGATDTVVTSINGTTGIAGWYENAEGGIFGFTEREGVWTKYQDPHLVNRPAYTKLLGFSGGDVAVGYYEEDSVDHGFELNLATGKFQGVDPPNAKSSAATGVNGQGGIVGWLTLASGATEGWLLKGGLFTEFAYPAAVETQPAGVDGSDDIAGSYEDAGGNTHGFLLTDVQTVQSWRQIDDPRASGETIVTSVNNLRSMAGYYQDASGNIDGFVAVSQRRKNGK
jgi:hypothetical protein